MEAFIHQQNILFLRKQLAEAPHETRRLQLLRLLAEEEAKPNQAGPGMKATFTPPFRS